MTKKFVVRAGNKFVENSFEMFVDNLHDVDVVLDTLKDCNAVLEPEYKLFGYVAEVENFIPENGDKEIIKENYIKKF